MKALVSQGDKLVVDTVPDPKPGAGELVLRVDACGICGTDLHMLAAGAFPPGSVPGHEFSGEVMEAAGGFRAGERVCALPALSCGQCERCRNGLGAYCQNQRTAGMGSQPGAFAEYVVVSAGESVRLPDAVDGAGGALVEPLAVALHAIRVARVRRSDSCVVIGGGPIGLGIGLWARHFGADPVIVSEKSEERRALVSQLGMLAVDPETFAEEAARRLPDGADVVLEAVGAPGLIQQALEHVRFRGRVVIAGVCMSADTIHPLPAITREANVHFVLAYEKDDFQYTVDMLEAGRIDPFPMVTQRVDLAGVPAAFDELARSARQCKVLYER